MERLESLAVFAGLVVLLSLLSWLLAHSARTLGLRVPRGVRFAAIAAPVLFLLPFVWGETRLASTDLLTAGPVPGVQEVEDAERYLLINDPTFQFIPWEAELRRLMRRPSLAFWSDRLEGGSSLWVNPQAQVLSPVAWMARLFPLQYFFLVKVAAQSTICFLGVWVLARRLGASSATSLAAACAAILGGGMIPWALFPHTGATAWVPWTTVGLLDLARRPRLGSWLLTSAAIAALLMSGHPEVAFAAGVAGGTVGLLLRSKRQTWPRLAGWWGSAAIVGFALAAPVVVPFLAALPESQRAVEMRGDHLGWPSLGWDPKSWFADDRRRLLLGLFHPQAMGAPFQGTFRGALNWLEAGPSTIGIWALAGISLALGCARRVALPLLGFGIFSLLAAAGFEPLVWVLRWLPGFSVMAFPRLLLVGAVLLCVAAALGWDAVRRRRPSGIMIVVLLVVAAVSWLSATAAWGASLLAWGTATWMVWQGDRKGRKNAGGSSQPGIGLWAGAGIGLAILSLAPWSWQMLPTSRSDTFYPPSPLFDQLAAATEARSEHSGQRILGTRYLGYPSLLTMYGFAQTRPHNPMTPRAYLDVLEAAFGFTPDRNNYFASVDRLSPPWLDFLGIGSVWSIEQEVSATESGRESGDPLDPVRAGLERSGSWGPFAVWFNPRAAAPWRLTSRWQPLAQEDRLARLRAWRPRDGVFVDEPGFAAASAPGVADRPPSRRLKLRSARPGRADFELVGDGTTIELLVTSWPGPDGWSVRWWGADGRRGRAERVRVQGAFLGAWIPKEAERLVVRYVPPGWLASVVIAALSGMVWILVAVRSVCGRRRFGQVASSSG